MTRDGDVTVVRGSIAALAREPVLSEAEHRRAEQLPPKRAQAFAAGRSLLRRLLGRWLACDPLAIELVEDPDEKPRLAATTDLDFNISHAGEHVLVAIARGRRVGVDVEQVSERRDLGAITDALPAAIREQLRASPPEECASRFTAWWVRVEAACKATGEGLAFPIDDSLPDGLVVSDVAMPAGYFAAVAFDRSVP